MVSLGNSGKLGNGYSRNKIARVPDSLNPKYSPKKCGGRHLIAMRVALLLNQTVYLQQAKLARHRGRWAIPSCGGCG